MRTNNIDTPPYPSPNDSGNPVFTRAEQWIEEAIGEMQQIPAPTAQQLAEPAETIEKTLCNRKTSIFPVPDFCRHRLASHIREDIKHNRPIRLATPQGCYKPSSLPSPGAANWADFIHLHHFSTLALNIASVHPPGVEFRYSLGDVDMDNLAEVSKKEVQDYATTFQNLVKQFDSWTPENIRFETIRLSDLVSEEEFRLQTEEQIQILEPKWQAEATTDPYIRSVVERSQRNNPSASEDELVNIAIRSEAIFRIDARYLRVKDAINVAHRRMQPHMVGPLKEITIFPLRSSKGGLVQFWVGEGGLVWNGKKLYPSIFGSRSVESFEVLGSVSHSGFEGCGPNFNELRIYKPK